MSAAKNDEGRLHTDLRENDSVPADSFAHEADVGHVRLAAEDVEAIARRVAELLADRPDPDELLDASAVARRYGVKRDWVYAHAAELEAIPLSDGPRPRLRFDPAAVERKFAAGLTVEPAKPVIAAPKPRRQWKPSATTTLLPIRDRRRAA